MDLLYQNFFDIIISQEFAALFDYQIFNLFFPGVFLVAKFYPGTVAGIVIIDTAGFGFGRYANHW